MASDGARQVEIGSPEFAALTPEDFDPEVCRRLVYLLLGPGYVAQTQDSTRDEAQA